MQSEVEVEAKSGVCQKFSLSCSEDEESLAALIS